MSAKEISSEIGSRLLFENDRVRVWDLQLAPGQSTGLHRHEHDYLYVVIGDGRFQAADAEGACRYHRVLFGGPPRRLPTNCVAPECIRSRSSRHSATLRHQRDCSLQ